MLSYGMRVRVAIKLTTVCSIKQCCEFAILLCGDILDRERLRCYQICFTSTTTHTPYVRYGYVYCLERGRAVLKTIQTLFCLYGSFVHLRFRTQVTKVQTYMQQPCIFLTKLRKILFFSFVLLLCFCFVLFVCLFVCLFVYFLGAVTSSLLL